MILQGRKLNYIQNQTDTDIEELSFKQVVLDKKVWLLFFVLQISSLRPLFKYVPEKYNMLTPVYFVVTLIFCILIIKISSNKKLRKFLDNILITIFLFIVISTINYYVYPMADGLKYQMRGSDQDDAIIQAGMRLFSGRHPYEERTYFGNEISPGPGLVVLLMPFIITKLYFLITPFFLLLVSIFIKKITKEYYYGNLFLLLIMTSLSFWELLVIGSDMIVVGILFVVCISLIYYKIECNKANYLLILLLTSMVATSRIIFIFIIPLIGVLMYKKDKKRGTKFTIHCLIFTILIHAAFWLWNLQSYTPLHLIQKGNEMMAIGIVASGLIICVILGILSILLVEYNLKSWMFYSWVLISTPLFFISFSDFHRTFNIRMWEGANYLGIQIPIYLTYFCLNLEVKTRNKGYCSNNTFLSIP